jgi:hypothetical protein
MESVKEVGILKDGVTQVDANHAEAVAKFTKFQDNKYRYFVKIGPEGNIYNPYGPYSNGSDHLTAKRAGILLWRFTEVSAECYSHYISFLNRRNHRSLHYAERELRNG